MKILAGAVLAVLLGLLGAVAFIWSGAYDVAADAPHDRPTYFALQTLRARSVAAHARGIEVPDLQDTERIRRGAGNYDAMCVVCHLAPGAQDTELSKGLYPRPPKLAEVNDLDPARAFWTIKHGIKASAMPAWGKSMDDADVWDLVAFVAGLPKLTPGQYQAAVAASEGHSHGGGEADHHDHDGGQRHMDPFAGEAAAQQPRSPAHDAATGAPAQGHRHDGKARPHAH